MTDRTHASPSLRALWQLRGLFLLTLGPSLGILLVGLIFGLPTPLRWQAAGMGLLMIGLFVFLFLKVRTQYLHTRSRETSGQVDA